MELEHPAIGRHPELELRGSALPHPLALVRPHQPPSSLQVLVSVTDAGRTAPPQGRFLSIFKAGLVPWS